MTAPGAGGPASTAKRRGLARHAAAPLGATLSGNLSLAVGISVWATNFLVTDALLKGWDAYLIVAGRLLSATCCLMAAYAIQTRGRPFRRVRWRPAWLLGAAGICVSTVCLTLGVKYSGAVPAAIVAASSPIVAALLAWAGFSVALTRAVVLGAAVAVAGGVLAAWGGGGEAGAFRGGELLVLAAVTVFTWYSLGAQHWMGGLGQLGISAITMMLGCLTMVALLPLLVLLDVARPVWTPDALSIAYLLFLGAGPASFSLFLWHWGVSRVGVTIASIYANLVPVVVVAIRMVQGQPPTAAQLAGGALIVAGVLLAQLLPARPVAPPPGGRAA